MSVKASWGVLLAPQAAMTAKALAQTSGWLGDSEQQRLACLNSEARQSLFLGCRYALRLLLAEDEKQVDAWTLGSAAECSPWVERYANARGPALPQLSLSHSGAWLACAKAPVAVGVDLEVQSPYRTRNIQTLAELVCAPAEQNWLRSQAEELQQQCFVQLWCLKEAYFKCLGTGVDLEKICHWTWRPNTSSPLKKPVAYARLWEATTETQDTLHLAVCALQDLPELMPWQTDCGGALDWRSITSWLLYESENVVRCGSSELI